MSEVMERKGREEILSVTSAATARIRELRNQEDLRDKGLRVRVVDGGCHGFSYTLGFDDREESDTVQMIDGVAFLVDQFSLAYLVGTSIDYVDGLMDSGFKIINPNASSTCGCGESFEAASQSEGGSPET